MDVSAFLAKWRVPIGWICGVIALYFSAPTPWFYLIGLLLAAFGEGVRMWAAGHLEKNRAVTTTGPYGWRRNPLYFGSLWVGLGFGVASGNLVFVVAVLVLFCVIYVPVMRRESVFLSTVFPSTYDVYSNQVPFFWPKSPTITTGHFSWELALSNRELLTVSGWLGYAFLLGFKLL